MNSVPLPLTPREKFSQFCGIIAVACGVLVLFGWHFDVPVLKSVFPGFISMKVNTAIGLLCFGIVHVLMPYRFEAGRARTREIDLLVFTPAFIAALIGVITIVQYVSGVDFGIDQLIYKDLEGGGKLYPPGRIAPITACSFILAGIGLFFGFFSTVNRPRLSQAALATVALISSQAIVSYALGIQNSFGVAAHTRIALHTAVTLIILSVGFLNLSADKGFVRLIFADTIAGASTRRLLLAALFVPPLVNALELAGYRAGYFESDFGVLFRVIGSVAFFIVMVVHSAEKLHASEERSRSATAAMILKENEAALLKAEQAAAAAREESEAKLRAELIEALERAERATRVKAEFLAHMSHEIRTPLNGILGLTDLLAETAMSDVQKDYVKTLQFSGTNLLTIINDVLDFSKIEAGKIELENIDFKIKTVVQGQIDLLVSRAEQKGLKIRVEFDPSMPDFVNGDAGRIGQILLNIIGNAIKFSSQGTIIVALTVIDAVKSGNILLKFSVRDSGIGLSLESQAKLFQPFAQADSSTSRQYGGTGLGLSICEKLVKLMGGEIGVISELNQGSEFWFTIEMQVVQRTSVVFEEAAQPISMSPFFGGTDKFRILVAEDNVTNQMVIVAHLKKMGLDSQAVANGSEVIDALAIGEFDLILMDCQMPVLDGYETTAKIRADRNSRYRQIPIVALTANAMKEDREKCLAAGMDAYLTKPFRRADLAKVLTDCLPRKQNTA